MLASERRNSLPMPSLLHNHPEFIELLRIVADELKISPVLVEKDYWIMHSLWGLQQMGLVFQLKGGTSLSKGFGIIDRFSEDIDILIEPPPELEVKAGKNHDKPAHRESRRRFYDYLAETITIDGIVSVQRDHEFDGDDGKYRQGGIRLLHPRLFPGDKGLKEGILFEAGFDDVTPNRPCDISSWAYDHAARKDQACRQSRESGSMLPSWLHTGGKVANHCQKVQSMAREEAETRQFHPALLRCALPAEIRGGAGFHWEC